MADERIKRPISKSLNANKFFYGISDFLRRLYEVQIYEWFECVYAPFSIYQMLDSH